MIAPQTITRRLREGALTRMTAPAAYLALQAMAQLFRVRRELQYQLHDVHPSVGVPFDFRAKFQFATRDRKTAVHAAFGEGRMHVGLGAIDDADVKVWFRSAENMRTFFFDGSQIFNMLLSNELTFDGNLVYLAKFGHMSLAVTGNDPFHRKRHGKNGANGHAMESWPEIVAPPVGEPAPSIPETEVFALEDPYLAHYSLDDFPRLKAQLRVHRNRRAEICAERPRLLTEFMLGELKAEREVKYPGLFMGRALHHIMSHKTAIVNDDDLLLGTTTSKRVGVMIYPEIGGTAIWPELLTMTTRELNPYDIGPEEIEILDREVFPYWMEDNIREYCRTEYNNPNSLRLDERFVLYFMWKNHAVSHTIIDYPRVLERGLAAIRDEAAAYERKTRSAAKKAYYQGMQLALEGVMDYARRLAVEARAKAAAIPGTDKASLVRRAELEEMAAICERVPAGPSQTLREAVQAVWIVWLALHQESTNAGLSVGRLDMWLEPYWRREVEGVTDDALRAAKEREALEIIGALMMKMTDHLPLVADIGNRLFGGSSSDQAITLGGVKRDGQTAVGDMTWVLLKAVEMLRLRDPNVNARYAPGVNSKEYLRRLCEVNLLTRATPSLHNDDAMIPSLQNEGFALPDARDWAATGCVEPTSCGRHFGHTNSMMFNMVAPLEMALNNGVHPILGEQVGPQTGDPTTFKSYKQFEAAYLKQLRWLIRQSVEINNMLGKTHQRLHPTPLLSAFFEGPMESGKDLIDGGAKYNSSGTAMIGLTDVVDSLAAIQTLVYEKRTVDMPTLLAALEADFVGHEALLLRLQNKLPKFGQDEALTNEIAHRLQDVIYDEWARHKNYRGGKYVPGYWSMSNHVAFGILSGALPSGRRRGKAFTPGLTPSPQCRSALTDQIRTVAGLDPLRLPNNIAFNVKVTPTARDSHAQTLDHMTAYAEAYFALGGMQMQFNVVSTETLKAAMDQPDEFRDLLVRISGYNAYFVELNRDMQIELIERTEHSV